MTLRVHSAHIFGESQFLSRPLGFGMYLDSVSILIQEDIPGHGRCVNQQSLTGNRCLDLAVTIVLITGVLEHGGSVTPWYN